jgi:hypothetical protein
MAPILYTRPTRFLPPPTAVHAPTVSPPRRRPAPRPERRAAGGHRPPANHAAPGPQDPRALRRSLPVASDLEARGGLATATELAIELFAADPHDAADLAAKRRRVYRITAGRTALPGPPMWDRRALAMALRGEVGTPEAERT